jgi:hypothetical protein
LTDFTVSGKGSEQIPIFGDFGVAIHALQRQSRSGLELIEPPRVALVAIAAALMWRASSAAPPFDYIFPAILCLLGESGPDGYSYMSCSRGLVQMGERHGQPDEAFLLILLGWTAFLWNALALIVGVCSVYEPFPDLPGRTCACRAVRR